MRLRALVIVPLLAALAVTGCGSDDEAAEGGSGSASGPVTEVTISDAGCEPTSISVSAGANTFHVTNEGSSAVTEFEILDAKDEVLGEVENVAAGLDRNLDITLKAGDYVTYCPHGTTERGTLTVGEG